MCSIFFKWIGNSFFGPPPPPPVPQPYDFYGFRWQPNQGIPNVMQGYMKDQAPPGVYVGFRADDLTTGGLFGGGNWLTVWPLPHNPAAALTTLIARNAQNPPPAQANEFQNVLPQREEELTGFFDYALICLDGINQIGAGQQLLDRFNGNNARHPVFVMPANIGNQIFLGLGAGSLKSIARQMMYIEAWDRSVVKDIVDQRYSNIPKEVDRYRQMATDLNNMPLYSLYVNANNFQANFLATHFRFKQAPIDYRLLMNWIRNGFAVFENFLLTSSREVSGVLLTKYFRAAVIVALYRGSPNEAGGLSTVEFNTIYNQNDPNDLNVTRPPAIGLAHELCHAMHNAAGTQPGRDFGDFSTTLTELLAVGIRPFQNHAISENTIRAGWPPPVNPGPFNNYAPGPRLIYEAPFGGTSVAQMRKQFGAF